MTDSKKDEEKRDETLKRMLETPPKPHDAPKGKGAVKTSDKK
jgi:hypothetical protein